MYFLFFFFFAVSLHWNQIHYTERILLLPKTIWLRILEKKISNAKLQQPYEVRRVSSLTINPWPQLSRYTSQAYIKLGRESNTTCPGSLERYTQTWLYTCTLQTIFVVQQPSVVNTLSVLKCFNPKSSSLRLGSTHPSLRMGSTVEWSRVLRDIPLRYHRLR